MRWKQVAVRLVTPDEERPTAVEQFEVATRYLRSRILALSIQSVRINEIFINPLRKRNFHAPMQCDHRFSSVYAFCPLLPVDLYFMVDVERER